MKAVFNHLLYATGRIRCNFCSSKKYTNSSKLQAVVTSLCYLSCSFQPKNLSHSPVPVSGFLFAARRCNCKPSPYTRIVTHYIPEVLSAVTTTSPPPEGPSERTAPGRYHHTTAARGHHFDTALALFPKCRSNCKSLLLIVPLLKQKTCYIFR